MYRRIRIGCGGHRIYRIRYYNGVRFAVAADPGGEKLQLLRWWSVPGVRGSSARGTTAPDRDSIEKSESPVFTGTTKKYSHGEANQ